MQAPRSTSTTGATCQQTRWRENNYTAVSWDYPPSPAAYYDALLSRGASYSRFLRIASSSTSHRPTAYTSLVSSSSANPPCTPSSPVNTQTTPLASLDGSHQKTAIHHPPIPPLPPYPPPRPCMHVKPRSANPMSHTLKRRKPLWPKPPHYHASLLRSPLSRRKGLFRAVLPPNKAVDFFRWDILLGAGVCLSASRQHRDWTRSCDEDTCASLHVAESVLEPYEAAAGFFGWHGLALDVTRYMQGDSYDDVCYRNDGVGVEHDGARKCESQFEIDEAAVEEGRARWARTAEELVGSPGFVLRLAARDGKSGMVTPAHKDAVATHRPSSIPSGREDVRWDQGLGSGPSHPHEKRQSPPSSSTPSTAGSSSSFKLEPKLDSPSAWWHAPSPHRGPPNPHLPPLRFLPPPSAQYGPLPGQLSPWFPGRVASSQGNGYWHGTQPAGAQSPVTYDTNLSKSLSHAFATSTSSQPVQYPTYPSLGRDEYGLGHDCDKEPETDHGYESTTTTTDSDPPPHTPVGATTSHCVEALQLHGDDDVEVHGVEINAEHAAASVTVRLPDPPIKLLDGFPMSPLPPSSSGSSHSDSERDSCESSKGTVVFPSLNGSFRQGSLSQTTVPLCSLGVSAPTTPARTVTPVGPLSTSSNEGEFKVKPKSRDPETSASNDGPAFTLSLCSQPLTSPSAGLRKDSQGFWEPVMPDSPSSSSSSLPLSPSDGRAESRSAGGWIIEHTGSVPRECSESPDSASSSSTHSAKSRSLSPGPCRVTSVASSHSSGLQPSSFHSPTPASASMSSGSYPSSPSPPYGLTSIPPNPTTLLPAFLATANVKRKKTSRTREIVDRLRSTSIDAGKEDVGPDALGWLSGSSTGGEEDGKHGKALSGLDHAAGDHVAGGQPSPSSPSQSGADTAPWVGSDVGKDRQGPGTKSSDSGFPGLGGKSNQMTQPSSSEARFSHTSPATATTTNPTITPFPILSVSQAPGNLRQSLTGGAAGCDSATSKSAERPKMNASAAVSPNARNPGHQLVPSTPNGGTSPSARPCHHPLPSPTHQTVHPPPVLGPPPPMLAVSHYPHPMYVPFTQYHAAPLHQQGQGAWVAVYPARPPHIPVHPLALPAQTHVAPITGISGMRHVSW